ncbi:MAG: hypothetical protein JST44_21885, partial [Cyanobacteria bacterium SZAS LIN-5]|nr:hypothetical protein [Cyanobacteria bacterium SZAS LIN-5]
MKFIKNNWFYVLAALVLAGVFYKIETMPSGIISTAPPPGHESSFKTYNNEVVPADQIDLVKPQVVGSSNATVSTGANSIVAANG